ncbi:MAG: hypothetical protein HN403_07875 [Rhodospirillales bacterium]|jgi:hypothetical protein|nr:hypothetical protein [Rhodospirillales bacterium]
MKPHFASSSVCIAFYVVALAAYFSADATVTLIASGLLVAYVGLEIRRIPRGQVAAGVVMIGLGLGTAILSGAGWEAMLGGVRRAQVFFLMFAAVAWLRFPADRSPSLRDVQERAVSQPPGRRFAILALASHILGSVLNMAGISLMSGVVRDVADPALRRRLTCAVMQGFTAASCWTPFFIAMTVVLSVIPGLRWSEVAPTGFLMAVVLTLLAWVMDRVFYRNRTASPETHPDLPSGPLGLRALIIPPTLFASVIFLVEGFHMPIPVALAVVAPGYAAIWVFIQTAGRAHTGAAAGELTRHVFHALPGLRSEVFLFFSANMLGTGAATALPPEIMKAAVDALNLSPELSVCVVMAGILFCAAVGLHPVIIFVLIGEVLPPEVLGVSPVILGAAMLAMWGLGAIVAPFSATTLYMARASATNILRVAWMWNGPYAILGTVLAVALILVARQVGFY